MIAKVDPLPHIPRADEPADVVWIICTRQEDERPGPIWYTRESPRGHVIDGGIVARVWWPPTLKLSVTEEEGSTVLLLPSCTPVRVGQHRETGDSCLFIGNPDVA